MVNEICKIEGCEKKVRSLGTCHMHYERFRRNGHYELLTSKERAERVTRGNTNIVPRGEYVMPEAKACTKCGEVKVAGEFYTSRQYGDKRLYPHCKACHAEMNRNLTSRKYKPVPKPPEVNGGICVAEDCEDKQSNKVHYLCKFHYARFARGTDINAPRKQNKQSKIEGTDFRVCTICDEVKGPDAFYKRSDGSPQSYCKYCSVRIGVVRQHINRDNDWDTAYELANSYEGRLKEKALAYLENKRAQR